jgi:hypothetical protein
VKAHELTIVWDVDSTEHYVDDGYTSEGLPNDPFNCDFVPGTTSTGDVIVVMPVGIPVANVVVSMGTDGQGAAAEWLVP